LVREEEEILPWLGRVDLLEPTIPAEPENFVETGVVDPFPKGLPLPPEEEAAMAEEGVLEADDEISTEEGVGVLPQISAGEGPGKVEGVSKILEELFEDGENVPFPEVDLVFLRDTLAMVGLARRYYFGKFTPELEEEIMMAKRAYKEKWPKGGERRRFRIRTDFSPMRLKRRSFTWAGRVVLRRQRAYRFIDYVFVLTLLGVCYRIFTRARPEAFPKFVKKSAMGVDSLFK